MLKRHVFLLLFVIIFRILFRIRFGLFDLLVLFDLFRIIIFAICVIEENVLTVVDDCLVIELDTMTDRLLNKGTGICSGEHKTHFTNVPVDNLVAVLNELVGINRKRLHVVVAKNLSNRLTGRRVVQISISINALWTIFEQRVTDHHGRIIMTMIPYHGNFSPVVHLERVSRDDTSIGTTEVIASSPTTEVVLLLLHFDFYLLTHQLCDRGIECDTTALNWTFF